PAVVGGRPIALIASGSCSASITRPTVPARSSRPAATSPSSSAYSATARPWLPRICSPWATTRPVGRGGCVCPPGRGATRAARPQRVDRGTGGRGGPQRVEADVCAPTGPLPHLRDDAGAGAQSGRTEGLGSGERGRADVDRAHLGTGGEGDHHAGQAQSAAPE